MGRLQRWAAAVVLVCFLLSPVSAYASSGGLEVTDAKYGFFSKWLGSLFSHDDSWEFHINWPNGEDAKDWCEKNDRLCQLDESYEIWKKWFCY
ncbi:hypothetical protein MJA45_06445 [Paenibacillus aurantius]|uniref:Uncharacterized protein n=1 Tax=Paenibacillus aurantius TaxID=2918900 RepID=A0AA96LF85_9BACL|nr:hypothetical protein [Paenibacillus aurantius]WJH32285.1 hypothetical protein N6H14_17850 [Paenibacillus sp. CC-CFT747]WNQ12666.1 hypothetical protein MJA45_06445 [Paenibacillus aurantius]